MASSGITFSGFNNIDFNTVINALMQQASIPLTNLQSQQSAVQSQISTYGKLTTQLTTLQSSMDALSTDAGVQTVSATSTDSSAVGVASNGSGVTGHYDVVVSALARAQVTASTNTAATTDTVVASSGTLTLGGLTIDTSQTGPLTLQQLADTINNSSSSPANAAIVQTASNAYKLVLTAKSTGAANGFTVTDNLTGTNDLTFGSNAVNASDASLTVNNVQITSSSNVITQAVPGATLTLYKQDPSATVGVDVSNDMSGLNAKITTFINAYNSFVQFANAQATAAANGDPSSIGRDPLLRSLRSALTGALSASYSSTGGALSYGSEAGIEFTQTGTLQLNQSVFDTAVANGTVDVSKLFAGTSGTPGLFASLDTLVTSYTQGSGIISSAQQTLNNQVSTLGDQITQMQARLAQQKLALQQEFTAADTAMSALNSQTSSLQSLGTSITSH